MEKFNGLGMNPGNLSRLSDAISRSISPENFTGEAGKGGMAVDGPCADCAAELGQGWKISPFVRVAPGETFTLADIDGSGAIQHIWMTFSGRHKRFYILRVYYEKESTPAIECPVCDFFAMAWPQQYYAPLNSLMVTYNPGNAFNCYWEMPFRKHCKITLTSMDTLSFNIFYQIDYTLTQVPEDCAYFCASFRRSAMEASCFGPNQANTTSPAQRAIKANSPIFFMSPPPQNRKYRKGLKDPSTR